MSSLLDEVNALAGNLDRLRSLSVPKQADAIDRVLAEPARTTEVVSVKDSAEMEAFREAVVDGLIQNDAVRQLLSLVNTVLTRVLVV